MKKIFAASLITIMSVPFSLFALPAQAAVSTWDKGANILPTSPTDFGSASFQQSLQNLKSTGSNFVALVVPYYQSNTGSTDIAPGYNTPTDASLASAIDEAHALGFAVAIKIHVEPYTGEWRAYINPGDRNGWFNNFGAILQHIGTLSQAHNVELIVMGTEMVSMASSAINSSNTSHWQTLIANLRSVYKGKLTYDANSTNNNNDPFENEKTTIGFWSSLDYAGLSVYYDLNTGDNSVQSLEAQWDYWNNNDLKNFAQQVGKPLLFTEIGYRSVDGAHTAPWDSQKGGNYNPTEQANDYDALMSYWNNFPYVQGVFWWDWNSNPNAGGSGDTSYTVQNKPAQQTLVKWFTQTPPPGQPGTPPTFMTTASANPASPAQGQATAITATVKNTGGALTNGIVDFELFDPSGKQVFQQYYSGQNIATNASQTFNFNWTAGMPGTTYHLAVGIFTAGWAQNLSWNNTIGQITVSNAATPPPTTPPAGAQATDVWWPSNGGTVTGVQPFKAMVENIDVSQYTMYWQVDGGTQNLMQNSTTDYPHKETLVDVSSWNWRGAGPYTINFVSKNSGGTVISQKSITIHVQ